MKTEIENEAREYSRVLKTHIEITAAYQGYIAGRTKDEEKMNGKDELIKVMDEYIELLSKGLTQYAAYLDIHGMRYDKNDIKKGKKLRVRIALLK